MNRRRDVGRAADLLVVLAPLVPVAVAALSRILGSVHHVGDIALAELDVRDLGDSWWTTGAWSRFGFRHPGPALTYLWAPAYRLFGSSATALSMAAAFLSAAALTAGVVVTRRSRGRTAAVGAALAALLLELTHGPRVLLDPWNPHPVLPLAFAAICGSAAAWSGSHAGAALTLIAASIAVQAHAGAVGLAATVGIVVLLAAWRHRSAWFVPPARRTLFLGVGATVLLWVPPLIDQFAGTGNLFGLASARFSTTGGLSGAWHTALRAWSPVGWWIRDRIIVVGPAEDPSPPASIPLLLLVVLAAMWLRHRGRASGSVADLAVLAAPALVGVVFVARMDAWLAAYLVMWLPPSVALATGTSLVTLAEAVPIPAFRARLPGLAVVVLTVLSGWTAVTWTDARMEQGDCLVGPAVDRMSAAIVDWQLPDGTVLVPNPDMVSQSAANGLILAQDREGRRWLGAAPIDVALRPERAGSVDGGAPVVHIAMAQNPEPPAPGVRRVAVPLAAQADGCGEAELAPYRRGDAPMVLIADLQPA